MSGGPGCHAYRARLSAINVHGCTGRSTIEQVAQALRQANCDVASLHEVPDLRRVQEIGRAAGLGFAAFARADFMGNGVVSRFPFSSSLSQSNSACGDAAVVSLILTDDAEIDGEKRSAVLASVDVPCHAPGHVASSSSSSSIDGGAIVIGSEQERQTGQTAVGQVRTTSSCPVRRIGVACVHLDHVKEARRLGQINQLLDACSLSYAPVDNVSTIRASSASNGGLRRVNQALPRPPATDTTVGEERPWLCRDDFFLMGDLNSLNRYDYSEAQWATVDSIRRRRWLEPASARVMTLLLDRRGFQDACPNRAEDSLGSQSDSSNDLCSVDPTSAYGTRVDYILRSANCSWEFIADSYAVIDTIATGVTDHRMVVVDVHTE